MLMVASVCSHSAAQERVARITQGIFLYSNWDAPHLTLDSCLDKTVTHVQIPDMVTWNGRDYPVAEIGPGAFNGCKNLMVLEFSSSVGFLKGALLDCPNLRVIKFDSCEPSLLDNHRHPFYGGAWYEIIEPYHTLTTIIVVPEGCEEAYRNASGWKEFKVILSHDPDGSELDIDEIDVQINILESELRKTQEKAQQLQYQIDALRNTKDNP